MKTSEAQKNMPGRTALTTARRDLAEQVRRLRFTIAAVLLAGSLLLAGAWIISAIDGIPPTDMTRDVTQTLSAPFYLGAISNIGILAWTTATALCLSTGAVLRRIASQKERSRFYVWFGLLTLALTLDDLFLVHEKIWPFFTGLPQFIISGLYALLAVAGIVRFHNILLRGPWLLFVLSLGFLGMSAILDIHFLHFDCEHHIFVEDSFKLFGVFFWACGLLRYALSDLMALTKTAAPGE